MLSNISPSDSSPASRGEAPDIVGGGGVKEGGGGVKDPDDGGGGVKDPAEGGGGVKDPEDGGVNDGCWGVDGPRP